MSHSDPKLDHAEDQNLEHIENAVEVTEVTTVYDRKQPYTTAYESYDRIRPYTKVTTVYDRYQDKDKEEEKEEEYKPPLTPPTRGDSVVASLNTATPVSGGGDCLAEAVPVGEVLPVAIPEHVTLVTFVPTEPVEQVKPVTPVTLVQAIEEQPAPVQVESPVTPIVQQAEPEPVEQEEQEDAPRSFISKAAQLAQRFKAKRLAEQQARPRLSSSAPVVQSSVQQAQPMPQVQPTATEQPHPQGNAAQAAYVERSDTMPSVAPSPVASSVQPTPRQEAQAQAQLDNLLTCASAATASPVQPPRSRRNRRADSTGDYTPEFLTFWNMYPKKVAKEAAFRAWVKRSRKHTLPPLDQLTTVLLQQSKTEQWLKDGGQFIPHPATWLNQARWDDQPVMFYTPPKPADWGRRTA